MFRHALLACLLLLGLVAPAVAEPNTAAAEIEQLLACVKNLEGARFIRNGTDHSPADAERHLRMKWEKQRARITTAEQFIELCATRSSTTGEPYQLRLPDGRIENSGPFLLRELARLRAPGAGR